MDNKVGGSLQEGEIKNNETDKEEKKEKPYDSIHARQICDLIGENPQEVNKRIDAFIKDDKILEIIFGKKGGVMIRAKLDISKEILDMDDKEKLKSMSEFKEFFEKTKHEKEAIKNIIKQKIKAEDLKKQFHEIPLSDELQEKKDRISKCDSIIANIRNRKDLKYFESGGYFITDIFVKNNDDTMNINNGEIICEFIFDYKETSANKKKRKNGQSYMNFFRTTGDISLKDFINYLNKERNELNTKIMKYKEKNKSSKISSDSAESIKRELESHNMSDKELEKETLNIFIDKIKKGEIKSISDKYYIEKDIDDMQRINKIIKDWAKNNIQAIEYDDLVLNNDQQKDTLKQGENISATTKNYFDIKLNDQRVISRINSQKEENLRGYVFDRLVEYIGMQIIDFRTKQIIQTRDQYKGTKYRIFKTDFIDDTYGGADFVVLFKFPGNRGKRQEIAVIDLLASETKYNNYISDKLDEVNPVKKKKLEDAEKEKFIYSTYKKLLDESEYQSIILTKLKRTVVEEDAKMIYNFLSKLMKGEIKDLGVAIQKYFDDIKLGKTKNMDDSDTQIIKILNGKYQEIRAAS